MGIQREIVRKVLSETDFVKSFKNAPEFSGSWGATIAELERLTVLNDVRPRLLGDPGRGLLEELILLSNAAFGVARAAAQDLSISFREL